MEISNVTDFLGLTNKKAVEPVVPSQSVFDIDKAGEKQSLYRWETLNRPHRTINKRLIRTVIIIAAVLSLLFVTMGEYLLVLAIVSVIFVSYILSATPPEQVVHEVSNHGVSFNGQFYYWNQLKHFFFTNTHGADILNIDTKEALPGRLYFMIKSEDKDKLKEMVGKYLLLLQEPPSSFIDKTYSSVLDKFSFDK